MLAQLMFMNVKFFLTRLFFYRQHPDAALRYLPIVDLLKNEKLDDSKILEVGSGSYGIAPYLKRKIVGVDLNFEEPEFPLLEQVRASATKLPFPDKNFDTVILSDVLEHLPKNKRKLALKEAVRVAKKTLIISGPFGKQSLLQDQKLAKYSKKTISKIHPYFKDHLENGLPEVADIRNYLRDQDQVKVITVIGRYLNLRVREWLMKFFITNNKFIFYFYLKGLMFLVPLLQLFNNKPCYRTLIYVKIVRN